jgi:hypothetical protein
VASADGLTRVLQPRHDQAQNPETTGGLRPSRPNSFSGFLPFRGFALGIPSLLPLSRNRPVQAEDSGYAQVVEVVGLGQDVEVIAAWTNVFDRSNIGR